MEREIIRIGNNSSVLGYREPDNGTVLLPANVEQVYQRIINESSNSVYLSSLPFAINAVILITVEDDSVSSDPGNIKDQLTASLSIIPYPSEGSPDIPLEVLSTSYSGSTTTLSITLRGRFYLPEALPGFDIQMNVSVSGVNSPDNISAMKGLIEGKKTDIQVE